MVVANLNVHHRMLSNLLKIRLNIQNRVNLCFLFDRIYPVDEDYFEEEELLIEFLGQPMTPVRLLYPVSRFAYMSSLKHIARFVIHRQIRRDRIDDLDLPIRLKAFLKEAQIYTENIPSSDEKSDI